MPADFTTRAEILETSDAQRFNKAIHQYSKPLKQKDKEKNIVVRFCLAFDIRFFDAHSIYQKRYCENIGPDALDMKYQQEIRGEIRN